MNNVDRINSHWREMQSLSDRKIIGFAEHHPKVKTILRAGHGGKIIYYIPTDQYDFVLTEHLSNQSRNIYRRTGMSIDLLQTTQRLIDPRAEVIYKAA